MFPVKSQVSKQRIFFFFFFFGWEATKNLGICFVQALASLIHFDD